MLFRPASHADYAALFPGRPRRSWRFAAVQIAAGAAWCLVDGDARVLLCGLFPDGDRLEAWLMMPADRPPGRAALRRLVRETEAVLPDRTIVVRINDRHVPGQRLAVMAGFVPTREFLGETRIRTWVRQAVFAPPLSSLASLVAGGDPRET